MVSHRQAAAQVVSYFKANKVGTANCKNIAELTKYDRCVTHCTYLQLATVVCKGEGEEGGL